MAKKHFTLRHMNAQAEDFAGNGSLRRYVVLPGSDGRAKDMAAYLENPTVKYHPRGHHVYLGTLVAESKHVDVAIVSSGMGCASMEIILHELFRMGAKRFLRVGTAGSLQPSMVKLGHLVVPIAAVRDESTTRDYVPVEVPAVASPQMHAAICHAAQRLQLDKMMHTGIVHCKSSLYAREFGAGPLMATNEAYMHGLVDYGVLATEMETSTLFIQSQYYDHQLRMQAAGSDIPATARVYCGAILGILGVLPDQFVNESQESSVYKALTELAFESIRTLALTEI